MEDFLASALLRHFGAAPFAVLGPPFEPVLRGLAVVLLFWTILFWMYRRRIFLRI
jgi:predicted acyltransferase